MAASLHVAAHSLVSDDDLAQSLMSDDRLPPMRLSKAEVDSFHEMGFLSVARISTPQEIAWMSDVFDRLFERRVGWETGDFFDFSGIDDPDDKVNLPQLLNPSRYEHALKNTVFRTNAEAMAKQILGRSAKLVFEHAMLKPAKTGDETPWHQDEAFFAKYTNYQSITFWMPLQPVDSVNGCLEFVPRSHRGSLLSHHRINNDTRIHGLEAEGVDPARLVPCPLAAGGATVHHSRTLHHAGPNRSDMPRRAYALGFGTRSRAFTVRTEFPWNVAKETARERRANEAQGPLQRGVQHLKSAAKAIIRRF